MSYNQLSIYERGRIEEQHDLEYSIREITSRLGRQHSSVSRELLRNSIESCFQRDIAQEKYAYRRRKSCWAEKHTSKLSKLIRIKMQATWLPEQIARTVTLGQVSTKTNYNWFYQSMIESADTQLLRHKRKRRLPTDI